MPPQAYPEYSRYVANTATPEFKDALVALETKYGKASNVQYQAAC